MNDNSERKIQMYLKLAEIIRLRDRLSENRGAAERGFRGLSGGSILPELDADLKNFILATPDKGVEGVVKLIAAVGHLLRPSCLPQRPPNEDGKQFATSFAQDWMERREQILMDFRGMDLRGTWVREDLREVCDVDGSAVEAALDCVDSYIRSSISDERMETGLGFTAKDVLDARYALERSESSRLILQLALVESLGSPRDLRGKSKRALAEKRHALISGLARVASGASGEPMESQLEVVASLGGVVGLLIGAGLALEIEHLSRGDEDEQRQEANRRLFLYLRAATANCGDPLAIQRLTSHSPLGENVEAGFRDYGASRAHAFELHFGMVFGAWCEAMGDSDYSSQIAQLVANGFALHEMGPYREKIRNVAQACLAIDGSSVRQANWSARMHVLRLSRRYLIEEIQDKQSDSTSMAAQDGFDAILRCTDSASCQGNLELAEALASLGAVYAAIHCRRDDEMDVAMDALREFLGSRRGMAVAALDLVCGLCEEQLIAEPMANWAKRVHEMRESATKHSEIIRKEQANWIEKRGRQWVRTRLGVMLDKLPRELQSRLVEAGIKVTGLWDSGAKWAPTTYSGSVGELAGLFEAWVRDSLRSQRPDPETAKDLGSNPGLGDFARLLQRSVSNERVQTFLKKAFPDAGRFDLMDDLIEDVRRIRNQAAHGGIVDRLSFEDFCDALLGQAEGGITRKVGLFGLLLDGRRLPGEQGGRT